MFSGIKQQQSFFIIIFWIRELIGLSWAVLFQGLLCGCKQTVAGLVSLEGLLTHVTASSCGLSAGISVGLSAGNLCMVSSCGLGFLMAW